MNLFLIYYHTSLLSNLSFLVTLCSSLDWPYFDNSAVYFKSFQQPCIDISRQPELSDIPEYGWGVLCNDTKNSGVRDCSQSQGLS